MACYAWRLYSSWMCPNWYIRRILFDSFQVNRVTLEVGSVLVMDLIMIFVLPLSMDDGLFVQLDEHERDLLPSTWKFLNMTLPMRILSSLVSLVYCMKIYRE